LIDHANAESDLEEHKEIRMKLSKQEEDMMHAVKSKMRYAGETYHRVAPAKIEINLLKGKRKHPDTGDQEQSDGEDYNTIEMKQSGKSKYQRTDSNYLP